MLFFVTSQLMSCLVSGRTEDTLPSEYSPSFFCLPIFNTLAGCHMSSILLIKNVLQFLLMLAVSNFPAKRSCFAVSGYYNVVVALMVHPHPFPFVQSGEVLKKAVH